MSDKQAETIVEWLRKASAKRELLAWNVIEEAANVIERLSQALASAERERDEAQVWHNDQARALDAARYQRDAAEAKLREARALALEEAASACLLIDRDDAGDCPHGDGWVWYGKSRDHAAARIRALKGSNP